MFSAYFKLEWLRFIRNRKQWVIGIILIFMFPISYFLYETPDETVLTEQLKQRVIQLENIIYSLPTDIQENIEGQEVYHYLTRQLSLTNMAVFYSAREMDLDQYVPTMLQFYETQLALQNMDQSIINPDELNSVATIERQIDYYQLLDEKNLTIQSKNKQALPLFINETSQLMGIPLFLLIILLISDSFSTEKQHQSIVYSLPYSFLQKAFIKFVLYFSFIISCLMIGIAIFFGIGIFRDSLGEWSYPNDLSISSYFLTNGQLMFMLFLQVFCLILATLLIGMLLSKWTQNTYVTIVASLLFLLLSQSLAYFPLPFTHFDNFAFLPFTDWLTGQVEETFGRHINYFNLISGWLIVLSMSFLAMLLTQKRSMK